MTDFVASLQGAEPTYFYVYISIFRYVAPLLVILLLIRCIKPLLFFRREPEIWAWLCLSNGEKLPITHWETVIGRSKHSDVCLEVQTVSRNHCVLTRYDDGSWTISDAESSSGLFVNGRRVQIHALEEGDVINIGGVEMTLQPISRAQEQKLAQLRSGGSTFLTSLANLLVLTVFQFLCVVAFLMGNVGDHAGSVLIGFGGIVIC